MLGSTAIARFARWRCTAPPSDAGARVSPKRERLRAIERTFFAGARAALRSPRLEQLAVRLAPTPLESRGFAHEGAGLGLALWDALLPGAANRLARFAAGAGSPHVYLLYVGAGWAAARLGRDPARARAGLDPLLGWLVVDGYGFHEGFFHPRSSVAAQRVPGRIRGGARAVFDQGLGRSLWFTFGADVERVAGAVANFSPGRRADLWSGVGLAAAYAGAADRAELGLLVQRAGSASADLAQGAAFAAQARARAGNPAPHTELACEVLCGCPAREAARLTDEALADLPRDGTDCAYGMWRRRIREDRERARR
jgi:hypothetical protein